MRILIEECLNWRLGRALTGHYGVSVQKMGWSGIQNGQLLALAQEQFDVFLTPVRSVLSRLRLTQVAMGRSHSDGNSKQRSRRLFPVAKPSFGLQGRRRYELHWNSVAWRCDTPG